MQLVLLIAGLVLLLAGQTWFAGAATVGWICLLVFVIFTVIQVLILAVASSRANSARNRRGF